MGPDYIRSDFENDLVKETIKLIHTYIVHSNIHIINKDNPTWCFKEVSIQTLKEIMVICKYFEFPVRFPSKLYFIND